MKKLVTIVAAAVATLASASPSSARCYGFSDCGPNDRTYNPTPSRPYNDSWGEESRRRARELERDLQRQREEYQRLDRERARRLNRY